MHRELVERFRWISERRFLHALNYCMVLPGPEAQQLATYIGWLMHGTRGGIVAGGLFVLPSLFILIALSWVYMRFGQVPWVAALLYGVKPAVVAIVLAAAWRIGSRTLRHPLLFGIAALAFLALAVAAVPFPFVILGAALLGVAGARFAPSVFRIGAHAPAATAGGPALIGDDTPTPPHARFSRARLGAIVAIFLAIWAGALGALAALYGWGWRLHPDGALLHPGGPPHLRRRLCGPCPTCCRGAVEQYHWLSAPQMIDGLALGETTPGPLIMVVAFVGFLGGWTKELLGGDALLLAGIVGACVATFFTFLPSFLFILAGGPLVERTRDDLKLTAPLTAITAAVVGRDREPRGVLRDARVLAAIDRRHAVRGEIRPGERGDRRRGDGGAGDTACRRDRRHCRERRGGPRPLGCRATARCRCRTSRRAFPAAAPRRSPSRDPRPCTCRRS
jgi:chromate transporter